jgi:hypothetical protein
MPTMPGFFSTFNSRPTVSGTGIIHWVGGFTDTQGGSTQNRALFAGVGATSLLTGGDFLTGIPDPVGTSSGDIDFDFRVSRSGSLWIDQVRVDTSTTNDGVMAINGMPIMTGGGMMRESLPVPASVGGLPGEAWDNFDFLGISDAGQYLVTGDTDAATAMDEFVSLDGQIILRESTILDLDGNPATLSGSIEGGYLNQDGDWAVIWDVDDVTGSNIEALIFNGEILLVEGDLVDWNGDGVVDGADNNGKVANFTGISALTVGARVGGVVNIYFTADIDFNGTSSSTDDLEGFFCLPVEIGVPAVEVAVDIKPGSCPNPLNRTSNGVLPVAVLGTDMFDVMNIDLDTVTLSRADGMGGSVGPNNGPPGPPPTFEDVAAPFMGEPCECDELGPDGITDLSLKFRTSDLVAELGLDGLMPGDLVELCVSGLTFDGTLFEGCGCVWIVPPGGSGGGMATVESNLPDVWVDVYPMDELADGGGFTNFSRFYAPGTRVVVKAPDVPYLYPSRFLRGWWINGEYYTGLGNSVIVIVTAETPFVDVAPQYGRVDPGIHQFVLPQQPGIGTR